MSAEQEALFSTEPYISEVKDYSAEVYPVLGAIGIKLDDITDSKGKYIRVNVSKDSTVYEYSTSSPVFTKFRDTYQDEEDNIIRWQSAKSLSEQYEGFVEGAYSLNDELGTPVLYLLLNITDIDCFSYGIPLQNIQEVAIYPEEAAEVMNAYQNADVDGSTFHFQRWNGLSTDVTLTDKELKPFTEPPVWPEPKVVYKR